jgi:hypothetical protein
MESSKDVLSVQCTCGPGITEPWECPCPVHDAASTMTSPAPSASAVRQNLRNLIGGHDCEPGVAHSDNLAIVLLTYFEDLPDCPDDDEGEDGWSAWALAKTNAVLDKLTDEVLAFAARSRP